MSSMMYQTKIQDEIFAFFLLLFWKKLAQMN